MMDALKAKVVDLVQGSLERLDGQRIADFPTNNPRHGKLEVMGDTEPSERQLCVPTPAGPRFFLVSIKETY